MYSDFLYYDALNLKMIRNLSLYIQYIRVYDK